MQLGSLWGPVAVGAAVWRYRGDRRSALGVLAAGLLAWQLAKVVKNRVGRGRPWAELDEIVHRGGTPYEGLGYVSGHTAVGAAIATYLGPQLSLRGRALAWVCVALIAFGRIHVSAHLPLDLVGGVALGMATGDVVAAAQAGYGRRAGE
jgi:undecaprenyl-diphosphatase